MADLLIYGVKSAYLLNSDLFFEIKGEKVKIILRSDHHYHT